MNPPNISEILRQKLLLVRGKRSKIVVEHILAHGFITTEDLETIYGYKHPPRAARDVREQGIPLETFRIRSSKGKLIAAYRFGDLAKIEQGRLGGRMTYSVQFKKQLYALGEGKCAIMNSHFSLRYLQIDHRIPYEIGGEVNALKPNPDDYMLLSGEANRAKSWSCEHCPNWAVKKMDVCRTCYWAFSDDYAHVATRQIRRLDVVWWEDEVAQFEMLKQEAEARGEEMPAFVKKVLQDFINRQR